MSPGCKPASSAMRNAGLGEDLTHFEIQAAELIGAGALWFVGVQDAGAQLGRIGKRIAGHDAGAQAGRSALDVAHGGIDAIRRGTRNETDDAHELTPDPDIPLLDRESIGFRAGGAEWFTRLPGVSGLQPLPHEGRDFGRPSSRSGGVAIVSVSPSSVQNRSCSPPIQLGIRLAWIWWITSLPRTSYVPQYAK